MVWKLPFLHGKTTSKNLLIYRLPELELNAEIEIELKTTTIFVSNNVFYPLYYSNYTPKMYDINGVEIKDWGACGGRLIQNFRCIITIFNPHERNRFLVYNYQGWSYDRKHIGNYYTLCVKG